MTPPATPPAMAPTFEEPPESLSTLSAAELGGRSALEAPLTVAFLPRSSGLMVELTTA
jgi:hypothetical protein